MLAGSSHLVECAEFELDFDTVDLAHARQSGLEDYVREQLLPVVNEVVAAADRQGWVLSLETLEVDLGAFAASRFESEAPARLRERLASALAAALGEAASTAPKGAPSRRSLVSYERELLVRYLSTGLLGARAFEGKEFRAFVRRVVTRAPHTLARALCEANDPKRVAARLVRQCPEDVTLLLARAVHAKVSAGDARSFERLLRRWEQAGQAYESRLIDALGALLEAGRSPRAQLPSEGTYAASDEPSLGTPALDAPAGEYLELPREAGAQTAPSETGTRPEQAEQAEQAAPAPDLRISDAQTTVLSADPFHTHRLDALASYEHVLRHLLIIGNERTFGPHPVGAPAARETQRETQRCAQILALGHPLLVARLRRALGELQVPAQWVADVLDQGTRRMLAASLLAARRYDGDTPTFAAEVRRLAADASLPWASLLVAFASPRELASRSGARSPPPSPAQEPDPAMRRRRAPPVDAADGALVAPTGKAAATPRPDTAENPDPRSSIATATAKHGEEAVRAWRQALLHGPLERAIGAWDAAHRDAPELLRLLLRELMGRLRGRHLLAVTLPDAQLREVLGLLVPAHALGLWRLAESALMARPRVDANGVDHDRSWVWRRILFALVESSAGAAGDSPQACAERALGAYAMLGRGASDVAGVSQGALRAPTPAPCSQSNLSDSFSHKSNGGPNPALGQAGEEAGLEGQSPTTAGESGARAVASIAPAGTEAPAAPSLRQAARDATAANGVPPGASSPSERFAAWLTQSASSSLDDELYWAREATVVLGEDPTALRRTLRPLLAQRRVAERAALTLSQAQLATLLHVLAPHQYRRVLRVLDGVLEAVAQARTVAPVPAALVTGWRAVLMRIAAHEDSYDEVALTQALLDALAGDYPHASLIERLRERHADQRSAHTPLWRRVLSGELDTARSSRFPTHTVVGRQDAVTAREPMEHGVDERAALPAGDRLYVRNAGLVLAGPYLARLFNHLELTSDRAFVSEAARDRAVHLTQLLVGEHESSPEYALPLNKVLVGMPIAVPLSARIEPSVTEREFIESLLQAMIGHWSAIGRTSVQGLRESFLRREGVLSFDETEGWQLRVASRAFDMLLDRLPWSYTPLRLPWMSHVLQVEWR